MKTKIFTLASVFGLVPFLTFAADTTAEAVDVCSNLKGPFKSIAQIFNWASCTLIKSVVPFLFTLATAAFIYGIIQYFINPDNEEKRKKGKSYMIWGIIALFVMISMWGLVGVLSNTFGVKTFVPQLSQ
jgi:hypothetical protein